MPLLLIIIGVFFIVASVRGTHKELWDLLKKDFTGPGNFLYWSAGILFLALLTLWEPVRPVAKAFLILIFIMLFIGHKDFFERLKEQTQGGGIGTNTLADAETAINDTLDAGRTILKTLGL